MQSLDRRGAVTERPTTTLHPATRTLILQVVRLGRGILTALEQWVQAHP